MDISVGRTLPHSLEAEQAVLGSMIISTDALTKAIEQLHTSDFYLEQHKAIYEALLSLFTESKPVDLVTLSDELGDKLELAGGIGYLGHIANSVLTTENIRYYIDIVKEKALLRSLIEAAGDITKMCFDEENSVSSVLDSAEQKIFNILQNRDSRSFYHIRDILPENIKTIEEVREAGGKITGMPTGFKKLDEITTGLHKTDLIILAARTGVGKTSFALNIATNSVKKAGEPVAIFSLEMSREQLVNRILWSEAKVDSSKIRVGDLKVEDMKKISHALGTLVRLPIYIDDTPGITVSEMRAKCRRLKLEKGLGLVVVDYLQLIDGGGRHENRQQEISEISRSLKIMAKDLGVPVITLSQLRRASEAREHPVLSDLRESGAIEQDADIVIFLNRKNPEDLPPEERNLAECIIAKHRNGSTGTFPLVWRGEFTTYMDIDPGHI